MVFKRDLYTKTWKVKILGGDSTKEENIVCIDSGKFDYVLEKMLTLGYRRETSSPDGIRYSHRSIEGLVLTVNKDKKMIKAETWEESGLSSVLNELNLPSYSSS
ncbi:MAG: hypothetical protein AABW67_03730 [Nanoarchaeota archaeon]